MNERRASPESAGAVCRMMGVAIVTEKGGGTEEFEDNMSWGFSNASLVCDVCQRPTREMGSYVV